MSGIEIYVKDEDEKARLIAAYVEEDERYLKALEGLKEELRQQGVDVSTPEGRRTFAEAVRKMNEAYGTAGPGCQG